MTKDRISPKFSTVGAWFFIMIGVGFFIVGVMAFIRGGLLGWAAGAVLIVMGTAFVYGGSRQLWAASVFKRGTSTAKAVVVKRQITKRRIERGEAGFEEVDVFELEVKFSPATSEEMTALAQVSQEVYNLHAEGKTITVEYATENPFVFVIEGEK